MGKNDRKRCFTISYYKCKTCGYIMSLPKLKIQIKERLHLKDMWCPVCKTDSQFTEFKSEAELYRYEFSLKSK